MQPPSQAYSQQASHDCAQQSSGALSNEACWHTQNQDQQKHSLRRQQGRNTTSQLHDYGPLRQSGTAATARNGDNPEQQAESMQRVQRQAYDPNEGRSLQHQSSSKAPPQRPSPQQAAAGQMFGRPRAGILDIGQGNQAGAAAAKPVMYVRPPWAIDDPYQVQCPLRPNTDSKQTCGALQMKQHS